MPLAVWVEDEEDLESLVAADAVKAIVPSTPGIVAAGRARRARHRDDRPADTTSATGCTRRTRAHPPCSRPSHARHRRPRRCRGTGAVTPLGADAVDTALGLRRGSSSTEAGALVPALAWGAPIVTDAGTIAACPSFPAAMSWSTTTPTTRRRRCSTTTPIAAALSWNGRASTRPASTGGARRARCAAGSSCCRTARMVPGAARRVGAPDRRQWPVSTPALLRSLVNRVVMPLPPALSDAATSRLPGATAPPEATPRPGGPLRRCRRAARSYPASAGRVCARCGPPRTAPGGADDDTGACRGTRTAGPHPRRTAGLLSQLGDIAHRLNSMNVNQELLKGELRQVPRSNDRRSTGWARPSRRVPGSTAPGSASRSCASVSTVSNAGCARSSARRRPTRTGCAGGRSARPAPNDATSTDVASDLFDYAGFEQRFRGDPRSSCRRWRRDTSTCSPRRRPCSTSVAAGVSSSRARRARRRRVRHRPGSQSRCRRAGGGSRHPTRRRGVPSRRTRAESLGAIVSTHVVEHLELDALLRFIELAVSRLRRGGVFIAETPNPASLIVLGNSYILDPTHVRPLHPSLLAFLCETAGFRDMTLQFYAPAEGYWLSPVDVARRTRVGRAGQRRRSSNSTTCSSGHRSTPSSPRRLRRRPTDGFHGSRRSVAPTPVRRGTPSRRGGRSGSRPARAADLAIVVRRDVGAAGRRLPVVGRWARQPVHLLRGLALLQRRRPEHHPDGLVPAHRPARRAVRSADVRLPARW